MAVASQHKSLMDEPGAKRLTFGGKLAVAMVTPHRERNVQFPSLAGDRVRVKVPANWDLRGISAHVLLEHPREGPVGGFQRVARGTSLINLLIDGDRVHPESLVNMGGGKLAHYRLDWGADAVDGFTLWQGPWSDVFTFDHETFHQALEAFGRFMPQDAVGGATLGHLGGRSVTRDDVTVDCGNLVLNLQRRDEGMVPPWRGIRGAHVELYRSDDDHVGSVLAVSSSAIAVVGGATGHQPVTDDEVAEMAEGLDLEWG